MLVQAMSYATEKLFQQLTPVNLGLVTKHKYCRLLLDLEKRLFVGSKVSVFLTSGREFWNRNTRCFIYFSTVPGDMVGLWL